MADLTDLDLTAPADSLYSGGVVLNTWRARIDALYTILGDITTAEANQVENIGTTTISATQFGYLGALDQSIISTASVDFGEVDITKTTTLAAGGFGLRCQVTHSTTGMIGTLRGAYIVATNAAFTATGVIRGAEIKARAATSGNVGGNVTTLEGVSISSDAKNKTVTTQRGMEVILDGKSGAAVTLGVGIRIANNYQANIATTSYAIQIYRDSFDYTADIQLSGGGLIGGSTGKIKMTSSGVTTFTAAGNLDIGSYNFRAATLTADGLTETRVIFAGASGVLSDSVNMTFVTDTLTVAKIGAFQATGAINFDSQNMTNVDIDSGTINGITDLAVADGGTGASDATNARSNLGLVIGTNVLAEQTIGIADDNLVEIDHADNGGVADNDYAKFTANGLEGREASEVLTDLGLDAGLANLTTAEVDQLEAIGDVTVSYAQWGMLGAGVEWTAWVPTLTGGADLSGYTHARYYRIGDICFFEFSALSKNVTSTGFIQITLPFTHANTGATCLNGAVHDGTTWVGYTHIALEANVNYISVYKTAAATLWVGDEVGVHLKIGGFFEIV